MVGGKRRKEKEEKEEGGRRRKEKEEGKGGRKRRKEKEEGEGNLHVHRIFHTNSTNPMLH